MRARSTRRAASATAPRIARAETVAPATKSGMQRRNDAAAQRRAGLARQERIELRLADRVVDDEGLVVEHDLGAGDAAGQVDARDHVERHARIAGRAHHIERREQIRDDLVALVDRDRGRRAFLGPSRSAPGITTASTSGVSRSRRLAASAASANARIRSGEEELRGTSPIIRAAACGAQSALSPPALTSIAARSTSRGRLRTK